MSTRKGDFIFDFYIESMNLLVEVDGEYWHRKNLMQVNRDKIKERLAREQGYDFVRISDRDWKPEIILANPEKRDHHSAIMSEREVWLEQTSQLKIICP